MAGVLVVRFKSREARFEMADEMAGSLVGLTADVSVLMRLERGIFICIRLMVCWKRLTLRLECMLDGYARC